MNINQKQTVLQQIEGLQQINLSDVIVQLYPGETDFEKINIGNYNASTFIFLFQKMISQLKNELENGLGNLLPFIENYQNDFGQVNLSNDLTAIQQFIASIQLQQIEPLLDKLIHYQIKNGFWDKSQIKFHDVDTEKLKSAQIQLELVQKSLSANLDSFTTLQSQYDTKIVEVETFLTTKKQELETIASLLTTATASNTAITELASSSKQKDTEIDGLLKNIKDKVKVVADNIEGYQTDFTTIQTESATLKTQLESTLTKALSDLEESKKGIEFVESKRSEIIKLTGMAADGSLGSKFNQRETKLADELSFWKWAVPIMTILTIVWVVVVFTCLSSKFPNEWLNIFINMLKTSPAFILLGFVFAQYKKERNLQEEYAFKSAVAMTLTAYSEMLSNEDDTSKLTSRQKMLLKSIEMVYNQPQIYPSKNDSLYSFNTKGLKETVATLSEALKNIKPDK